MRSASVGSPDGNIYSNSPFFTFDKMSVHIDRFLIPFKTLLSPIKSDISDSRVVNFKSVAPLFPLRKSSAMNSPRNSSAAVWVGTMTVAQADGGVEDNSLSKCDTLARIYKMQHNPRFAIFTALFKKFQAEFCVLLDIALTHIEILP